MVTVTSHVYVPKLWELGTFGTDGSLGTIIFCSGVPKKHVWDTTSEQASDLINQAV
jgi:hypothetical protein